MKIVLERAGLETAHGLYDLRHTFVSTASPISAAISVGGRPASIEAYRRLRKRHE